jgi:hypothetical protein
VASEFSVVHTNNFNVFTILHYLIAANIIQIIHSVSQSDHHGVTVKEATVVFSTQQRISATQNMNN